MELSLDDIIKQNKTNRANQRKGNRPGNNKPRNNAGKTNSPRRNNQSPRKPGGQLSNQGTRKPGGGVMRGRNRGGITRRNSGGGGGFGRQLPSYKREAFLGSAPPRRFGGSSEATKLIVSNLDFGVTDSDILELFGEFGPLKSAGVHYDRSGRSMGSADLIFERRADAIKAMKQYNGVPLDGREMNIQLATSEIPSTNPIRNSRLGNRPTGNTNSFNKQNNRKPNQQRGTGGGLKNKNNSNIKKNNQNNAKNKKPAGGSGGRQKKAPPPTAEELDAQLEEYVKSKVASSDGA